MSPLHADDLGDGLIELVPFGLPSLYLVCEFGDRGGRAAECRGGVLGAYELFGVLGQRKSWSGWKRRSSTGPYPGEHLSVAPPPRARLVSRAWSRLPVARDRRPLPRF